MLSLDEMLLSPPHARQIMLRLLDRTQHYLIVCCSPCSRGRRCQQQVHHALKEQVRV